MTPQQARDILMKHAPTRRIVVKNIAKCWPYGAWSAKIENCYHITIFPLEPGEGVEVSLHGRSVEDALAKALGWLTEPPDGKENSDG